MWADDRASPALGMTLDAVDVGMATLSMTVRADMVNGLDICHGGLIFTLADSAMAFASNSYNQRAVAQGAEVYFLAPARLGMRLLAEARERHRAERTGIYDVTVRDAATGTVIAEFRGMTRTIAGKLVET
jgi:phenylacetic acid degradation protein PaaD